MKVMIITSSTGGGHNSAARYLKNLLDKKYINSDIYDITAMKWGISFIPSTPYEKIIKYFPKIYGFYYNLTDKKLPKDISIFMQSMIKEFYKNICEYKPDLIFSCTPVSVLALNRIKEQYEFNIPFIQLLTDIHVHQMYVSNYVNAYISQSEYSSIELAKKGIEISKIYDFGIPIDDRFRSKEYKKEFNNNIAIILGSMGFERDIENLENLIDIDDKRIYHFITGNNLELKKKLELKFKEKIEKGNLIVYEFINNVDEILKNCDMAIIKSGGLLITECINLKKPMLIFNSIPGQEEESLEVLKAYGVCIDVRKKNIYSEIEKIYSNKESLKNFYKAIERISKNYSNENTIKLIKKLVNSILN